jgi:phosphate transport system permease protein
MTLLHLLLLAAVPGLLVGLALEVGRAMAETSGLFFTSGYVDRMPGIAARFRASVVSPHLRPLDERLRGDVNAYALALVLVALLLAINRTASWLAEHRLHWRIVTV